jgi:hypothetical protein
MAPSMRAWDRFVGADFGVVGREVSLGVRFLGVYPGVFVKSRKVV